MNITRLQYFLELASALNFRRAAEKLYISEQTLSANIKKLEEELGSPLFERRPVPRLTPAGESLVRHAREIVNVWRHLGGELADLSEQTTGTLHIGTSLILASAFLPRIWAEFHRSFPNIHVSLSESRNNNLDEMLRRGELDLYISFNAPKRSDTHSLTLAVERCCCVFSAEFLETLSPRQRQQLLAPAFDLMNVEAFPLLLLSRGNGLREDLERFFMENALRPTVIFESRRSQLLYKLCGSGSGVGLIYRMSAPAAGDSAQDRGMYVRPVKNAIPLRRANLVYRKESVQPKYVRGFIEIAKKVLNEYSAQTEAVIDGEN